jgi:hypothetical protein
MERDGDTLRVEVTSAPGVFQVIQFPAASPPNPSDPKPAPGSYSRLQVTDAAGHVLYEETPEYRWQVDGGGSLVFAWVSGGTTATLRFHSASLQLVAMLAGAPGADGEATVKDPSGRTLQVPSLGPAARPWDLLADIPAWAGSNELQVTVTGAAPSGGGSSGVLLVPRGAPLPLSVQDSLPASEFVPLVPAPWPTTAP